MSSFTWKRPRDLETQQGRATPQDLETRYEGADIEPASLATWRLLMEELISSAGPAIAFIGFLQTMQAHRFAGEPKGRARILARRARPYLIQSLSQMAVVAFASTSARLVPQA